MGSAKFGRGGLARMTAPASRSAHTAALSLLGKLPRKASQPICVGISLVSSRSLMPMGIPSMAERGRPAFQHAELSSAAARGAGLIQGDEDFDDRLALFESSRCSAQDRRGGCRALAKAGHGIMEGERLEGAGIVASGWTGVHGQHPLGRHDRSRHKVSRVICAPNQT